MLVDVHPVQAACAALPSDKGQVTLSFSTPTAATYRVWLRMYVPAAGVDAVAVQVDQTLCQTTMGAGGTMPAGTFVWVDWRDGVTSNKVQVTLPAGGHTITLAGVDNGAMVDKVLLDDTGCTPTGTGGNCGQAAVKVTPAPTASGRPSQQPTGTPLPLGSGDEDELAVSGSIDLGTAQKSDGTTVTYTLDGKPVTGVLDTTKLSNGKHTLEITETAPDGTVTTTTRTLDIRNGWQYALIDRMRQWWPLILVVGLGLAGGVVLWRRKVTQRAAQAVMLDSSLLASQSVQSNAGSNSYPK